jgi:hypothetical protein
MALAVAVSVSMPLMAQEGGAPVLETYAELEASTWANTQTFRYQQGGTGPWMAGNHAWLDGEATLSFGGYYVPLRMRVNGRYTGVASSSPSQDPTVLPAEKLDVDARLEELGLTVELLPGVFVGLGKKKLEAGSGLFQAPSDLFGFRESAAGLSESAIEEGLVGIDVKFLSSLGTLRYFYYPTLEWDGGQLEYLSSPQPRWGHTASLSSRIRDIDFSLLASWAGLEGEDGSLRFGANASATLLEAWTVRVDASLTDSIVNKVVEGAAAVDDEVVWFPRVSLGLQFDADSDTSMLVEYYYNGRGLEGSSLEPVIGYVDPAILQSYGNFGVARHYAMERLSRDFGEGVTLELLNVHSLGDSSGVASFRLEKELGSVVIAARLRGFYGPQISEFGGSQRIWDGMLEARLIMF